MSYKATDHDVDKNHVDFCDRVDSGFDSGLPSYRDDEDFHSGNLPSTDNISSKVKVPGSVDNSPRVEPKEIEIQDECFDSGYKSTSMTEEEIESFLVKLRNEAKEPKEETGETENLQFFTPDEDGDTYLQLAIIHGKIDLSFDIIQSCTKPYLLDIQNSYMQTALHLAVLTDHPEITRCLVAYGANVNCTDKKGNTPLHIAADMGYAVQIEMLTTPLDPKENPGYQTCKLPQNVDVLNYSGFAPIHLAARSNRANVVRRLVRVLKCNINIGDSKSGRTALHHAIECRSTEAMKMLLKYGIHTNTPTYDDCTALHLAVAKGMPLVVTTLLNHKADLFSSTHDNQDVFDLAVRNPQMLRHLKSAFKLKH